MQLDCRATGSSTAFLKRKAPRLQPWPLPLVRAEHAENLALQGWTTTELPSESRGVPWPHPLQSAYEDLFAASQAFFAQPAADKQAWRTRLGSEEGWSVVAGEKEMITLRSLEHTPDGLRRPAARFWKAAGDYLDGVLERVSLSLGLEPDEGPRGLRQFLGPCRAMQAADADKTATMLRLFRYEGDQAKVVAERESRVCLMQPRSSRSMAAFRWQQLTSFAAHADLGLLSLVVGKTPGLEVWDAPSQSFFPIEQTYHKPAATLLAGRQLERLTNFRYRAGRHRVVSYGAPPRPPPAPTEPGEAGPSYRFSIVFVLRAHEDVTIDTNALTTKITGDFEVPLVGVSAEAFFAQIRGAHFNINTHHAERNEQREKLAAKN